MNISQTPLDSYPQLRMGKEHVINRQHFADTFMKRKDEEGLGMRDSFREMHGQERKYSYRPPGKAWGEGMDRVDLILVSEEARIKRADILDSELERGRSDHAPLWVEVEVRSAGDEIFLQKSPRTSHHPSTNPEPSTPQPFSPPPPPNPNPLGAIGERHPKPPSPTPFAIAAIEHNDNEAIRNAPAFKNARREPPAAAFTSRRETGKSHGINDTANSVPTPNANDNNNRASENHSLKAAQRARTSTSTSTSASPFTSNNDNDDNDPISDLHARWIAAYKQHTGSEEWLLKARAHAAAARTDAVARVADEIRWLKWRINGGVGRAERAGMQERLEVLLAVQRGRV
ncbi:MAG: hypothetical protein L6R42_008922 [Xanthoria sp. 1 TBL-2021]|nr:MAG: hypothetical protein L6R42_008922 [Xanthoria sp. 1 TBL-2021]